MRILRPKVELEPKVEKEIKKIQQLPEQVTSAMLEDKLREVIEFLNK